MPPPRSDGTDAFDAYRVVPTAYVRRDAANYSVFRALSPIKDRNWPLIVTLTEP